MDMVTGLLGLSLILQLVVIWLAVRLMRVTKRYSACWLLALAVSLMTARRLLTFWGMLLPEEATGAPLLAEVLALSISLCLVIGMARMGVVFHALRRAEEIVQESEARYRNLVESSIQGMLIHQEGRIRVANKAVAAIFGYSHPAALVGQDVYMFLPAHEVQRLQDYNAARLRGDSVPDRYEAEGQRQDGTVVWLEILASILSWENRPAVMITFLDITARREAERALATRMQQLDAVRTVAHEITQELDLTTLLSLIVERAVGMVGACVGAISLWDESTQRLTAEVWHGDFAWVSTMHLQLGDGLIGTAAARRQGIIIDNYEHSPYALPQAVDAAGAMAALAQPLLYRGQLVGVLATGRRQGTQPFTQPDLDMLELLATQAAIAIENARLFTAVKTQTTALERTNAALHDEIIERQRVEEERERLITDLEARNTEMERFTYTVSHDLKSPLITIQGFLDLLEQDITEAESERMARDFNFLRSATDSMQHLLDDLLELSRIGRVVHPPRPVSLDKLVQDALDLVAGRLRARGVHVDIVQELPMVFGDRARLLQVLQNLLDNAIKFMGEQSDPRIVIGARQEATETVCYVRDNGIGIDPRYHLAIFGLFQRLEASNEGTGIGLTLVKRIIEVHGGRVWVESAEPHCGSTFYFTLPRQQEYITA